MSEAQDSPISLQRFEHGRVTVVFGAKNGKYPDGNQVLVRGSDTRTAFDTPRVANHIGPELDECELVVMGHVHEDHMAGLHRLPHATVYAHEADLPALQSEAGLMQAFGITDPAKQAETLARYRQDFNYAPRPDAKPYRDGDVWDLGQCRVRAVHMPGHTAGHSVLVVEPEGVAFIGDIDLTGFGPYYGDTTSNLRDFRRTLARLPEVAASVWVTSHHRGVYTDRALFLRDLGRFAAKIDERTERLLGWLREGPHTLAQLAKRRMLYPVDYAADWVDAVEARSIAMHLDELAEQHLVRREGNLFALNA